MKLLQFAVGILLVTPLLPNVEAAILESPSAGKAFKAHERVACAGTCGAADGVIAVAVKNKKGVIQQSAVAAVEGELWTIVLDPPRGGWPLGEMTVEVFSGREAAKQGSAKIIFKK
jgi:hypothetical protein